MFSRLSELLKALLAPAEPAERAPPGRPPAAAGPYLLGEPVGRGGACAVYRARHAETGEPAAVKLLHAELASRRSVARFEREIARTRSLDHPHIVRVLGWGRGEAGTLYYAMELIEGPSLLELIERYGPQPDGRVIRLLGQAAEALAAVHAAGLVHRDIKPVNLMLGPADQLKLIDFGLCQPAGEPDPTDRRGTPGYLAPELGEGAPHSPAGDLYALGAVARELLTGGTALPLRDLAEEDLRGIIAALCAAEPRRRPAGAAALARASSSVQGCRGRQAARARPATSTPSARWPESC